MNWNYANMFVAGWCFSDMITAISERNWLSFTFNITLMGCCLYYAIRG